MQKLAIQDAISEMVRRIVAQFDPEKIILFGSHARGSVEPDSDVDLLVVMNNAGKTKRNREMEIRLALRGLGVPKDVIVVTPQEFKKYRNLVGTIVRPASREGKILYDRAA